MGGEEEIRITALFLHDSFSLAHVSTCGVESYIYVWMQEV